METRSSGSQSTIGQVINHIGQQAVQAPPIFDPAMNPTTPIPSQGSSGVWKDNFGKFERRGATYSWKIHRQGKDKLVGHSKPRGMAEKVNKQELLLDIISRLNKNDYIREGIRIEFYRNISDDDNQSVHLMTIYGNRYVAHRAILQQSWLLRFLDNFYSPPVHTYGNPEDLFPTGGQQAVPDGIILIPDGSGAKDPFDLSRHFRSSDKLLAYIEKLTLDGHPHDRIAAFYQAKIQTFHDRNIKPIR